MVAPYALFFTTACALLLGLIWREAARRGFAADRVAAAMAACAAGAVLGARTLMFDFHAPAFGEKTVLGAMVGGMLTLALVSRVLRFDARAFDVPVIPALWAAAVGRVGCLLAGCCHGLATSAPWAIRYASDHPSGGVPVHPTQLYEALGDATLALLLTRHRDRFRQPGSLATAGGLGLAVVRFAVEPLRASAVVSGPLTLVQWTLLVVMCGILLTAFGLPLTGYRLRLSAFSSRLSVLSHSREAESTKRKAASRQRHSPSTAPALIVAAVMLLLGVADDWFTPLEQFVIGGTALAAGCVVFAKITAAAPAALRMSPLVGMMTLAPLQVFDTQDSTRRYWAVGGGGMAGGYEVRTEDCEGNTISRTQHQYNVAAVTGDYRLENTRGEGFGIRLSAFNGTDNSPGERNFGPAPGDPGRFADRRDAIRGGSALVSVDGPVVGVRLGMAAGHWNLKGDYPMYDDGSSRSRVHPIGGLRLGSVRKRHGEVMVGTGLSPAPTPLVRVGLAIPDSTGRKLFRIGISDGGAYVGGQVVTEGGFEFEPFVVAGSSTMFQGGLMLRRRFYMRRPLNNP